MARYRPAGPPPTQTTFTRTPLTVTIRGRSEPEGSRTAACPIAPVCRDEPRHPDGRQPERIGGDPIGQARVPDITRRRARTAAAAVAAPGSFEEVCKGRRIQAREASGGGHHHDQAVEHGAPSGPGGPHRVSDVRRLIRHRRYGTPGGPSPARSWRSSRRPRRTVRTGSGRGTSP
ncbi:tyrosinase family oxidase copper chaperone [Streptomyces olivaceoviridis]|uniref:tyrosinase family oxidase copper chaperone n=1 Tax=Streptomyces olivaceoviridis TaxID=1921 RepID=UPI0036886F79